MTEREIITTLGVQIPFYPEIIPKNIEMPLRRGRYEGGEVLAIEKVSRPGDRILELGTGLGLVSTKAALVEGVDKVLTFEANPKLIPVIRETHELNGVTDKIEVVNAVVTRGDAPETLPFYTRPDFWGSSLSPIPRGWTEEIHVPTRDLDEVLREFEPTVIVMDIEGAELDLLEGADLTGVRFVTMEIHPRVYGASGTKRIFDSMSAKGFGYSPKVSRGGTVITFERTRAHPITQLTNFAKDAPVVAQPDEGAPRILVTSCMKNEGPFILEWIAYHRMIGVTDFVIFSNDCDDGTDDLLDRLDDLGLITHIPNPASLMKSPSFQPIALAQTRNLPAFKRADYVISMDVDEFINVKVGDGSLQALFDEVGDDFDVISLNELNFGCDMREHFKPGFVTEQFTACDTPRPGPFRARRGVKSILRPRAELTLKNHRPRLQEGIDPSTIRWLDGSGRPMPEEFIAGADNGIDCRRRYQLAILNHYPVRSMDSYLVKRDRGDVVVRDKQVGLRYWRVRNNMATRDNTLANKMEAVHAEVDYLLRDPQLKACYDTCVERHQATIVRLRALPDYQDFLEQMKSSLEPDEDTAEDADTV